MLTRLKQKVQQMLTAEARAAHRIGLTPNMISGIGLVLAFLSAFTYAEWQKNALYLLLATVLLLLSGFCDALDGIVARLYEKTTVFGGFLDSLLDRYADAAVYIGIIVRRPVRRSVGLDRGSRFSARELQPCKGRSGRDQDGISRLGGKSGAHHHPARGEPCSRFLAADNRDEHRYHSARSTLKPDRPAEKSLRLWQNKEKGN